MFLSPLEIDRTNGQIIRNDIKDRNSTIMKAVRNNMVKIQEKKKIYRGEHLWVFFFQGICEFQKRWLCVGETEQSFS